MAKQPAITLGTDPEAFLFNTETNRFVPSCGLIGGTKDKPLHYAKKLVKGFTVQEDNVTVEFNIPPAMSHDQWCDYLVTAISSVSEYVAGLGPYVLKFVSQNKFPHKDMQSEQAQKFGCSPDFDAYNSGAEFKAINPDSLSDKNGQWRFAGGHVHVGFESEVPAFVAAAFADYFLGLQSIGYDKQERRRSLYGQPGRHRVTSYGIEYRTLSNYWLADIGMASLVGMNALSLGLYLSRTPVEMIRKAYQKMPWGAVRQAISNQDSSLRHQIHTYVGDEGVMVSTSPSDI